MALSEAAKKYFAYYVDLEGVAHASYELKATNDDAATSEARHYLRLHPSIEVWQGARWVTRMTREKHQ